MRSFCYNIEYRKEQCLMYKFCKANGVWWLICKDLQTLFEFKEKTSRNYALALLYGNEENQWHQYYDAAKLHAKQTQSSLFEGMADLQARALSVQMNCLLKGEEVWFNENGGWNNGISDVAATTYTNQLIFPNCQKKDIRITKFAEGDGGRHYYARIGTIEVCEYINGYKIMKWDTYEEAYQKALIYCKDLSE